MMRARSLGLALVAFPVVLLAQENDPPARAGRISSVAGTVAFQAAGTPDWAVTPLNYTVGSGDRLLTHRQSRAELEVGPFDVRLADSTDLSVVNLTDDFTQLGLTRGTLRVSVYRLASRDSMEVDTPNGAIVIRSAGRYRIDVLENVSTIVSVEDGVALLSGPALDYTVKRGQTIELTGTNAINASMIPHPRNSDFDDWSAERDRRQETSTYTRYMSRDIPGGADLDRHGRWEYAANYGYVWRPTIVTVGWVPYRYGRWVWSNVWGWTWVEDAPWGFAPFHYGRWVVIGGVYAWAPGPIVRRPYYAPALVVFVGGPRYHQAWFPLGWHEPYYPRYRHSDRYLREVNIANVRNISNVDEFIDVRRADRIDYSNRRATTVVSDDVFGRRRVSDAATSGPVDIRRAAIVRDRWETPRLATNANAEQAGVVERTSSLRPRREATPPSINEPTRTAETFRPEAAEPRRNAPLIYRNAPPIARRPSQETPRSTFGETPSRRAPAPQPQSGERRPTVIRRNDPPQSAEPSGGIDRSRRPILRGSESGVVERPAPREYSPRSVPARESTPRASTPRESSPSPRASAPPPSESRGRMPTASSGAAPRVSTRRPPA